MLGRGDDAGRAGATAVATQVGSSSGGTIKKSHVVKATALATLYLEVSKDQSEGAISCPDAPAALCVIGVALGVLRAGDLPRQPRQLPTTCICKEVQPSRSVSAWARMDTLMATPFPITFVVGGSKATLGHMPVRAEDHSHDVPGRSKRWWGTAATEGAQKVALVPGCPIVDLEIIVSAGGVVLQLKVAEGEQDGGALGHHDQPGALRLVGVWPREIGAGEVARGC